MAPSSAAARHRVQDREQFPHARDEGHFLGLTRSAEPPIEGANYRVPPRGYECTHGEPSANRGAAAPDQASASKGAAVTGERSHADQRRDLFAGEAPELRELTEQRATDDGAHSRHTWQQIVLGPPDRALLDEPAEVAIDLSQFALEPADVRANTAGDGGAGEAQAVALGGEHLEQLPAAGEHRIEGLGRLIGQRPGCGAHPLGEERERLGVNRIGLGELPRRPGEIAHLPRIGDHDWHRGGGERSDHGVFKASGRLQDHERRPEGLQSGDQREERGLLVDELPALATRPHRDLESGLGHVDADKDRESHESLRP
jgi:hypothetical protein